MKDGIHPTYHSKTKLRCSCGNEVEVGSVQEELHVEVCSACHPFYTGKQKLVDVAGRIDKFKKRMEEAEKAEKVEKKIKVKQAKKSQKDLKKDKDSEIKIG